MFGSLNSQPVVQSAINPPALKNGMLFEFVVVSIVDVSVCTSDADVPLRCSGNAPTRLFSSSVKSSKLTKFTVTVAVAPAAMLMDAIPDRLEGPVAFVTVPFVTVTLTSAGLSASP